MCDNIDCIQTDCNRLQSNGCNGQPHTIGKVCGKENMYMWYDGKNKKKNINNLEDLFTDNTNGQECE